MWDFWTLIWFAVGVSMGVGMSATTDYINKQIDKKKGETND
jgi:hypothetical protein